MPSFTFTEDKILEPIEIVKALFDINPTPSDVLDLGIGTGRNGVFLAQKGYRVHGVDLSKQTIDGLNDFAKKTNIPLTASVMDISDTFPDFSKYTVVLFTFIMHYLSKERGNILLRNAMEETPIGGMHVHATITTEGDFYVMPPKDRNFYLKPGELEKIYIGAGWTVEKYFEEIRPMKAKKPDGSSMKNKVSFLIAKKLK